MLVANSFDLWQRDTFFSAAEEVQESADILESAYQRWVSEKREGMSSNYADELLRGVQTALGTAKWQLEEFGRAVSLNYGSCRDQNGMARHQQFIFAIESQISHVEDALRESLEEERKEPLRWVDLNADERDDLAMFLSGMHGELTKNAPDESAKLRIRTKMDNMYRNEDLDYATCSSGSGQESNIQAKHLTSCGDDIVISIGSPDCGIEFTAIEALGTRGYVNSDVDRDSSTKRTRASPKFSYLRFIVPSEEDGMGALMQTVEATPKVKGSRASSYLRLRAMNCINKLTKCYRGFRSMMQSQRRSQLNSLIQLVILLTVSFFLLGKHFITMKATAKLWLIIHYKNLEFIQTLEFLYSEPFPGLVQSKLFC